MVDQLIGNSSLRVDKGQMMSRLYEGLVRVMVDPGRLWSLSLGPA